MQCKTTKHAWEKLKCVYDGVPKVKKSKLQTYKGQFESLKVKYFGFRKDVFVVKIYIAAEDRDQGSNEKPMRELKT